MGRLHRSPLTVILGAAAKTAATKAPAAEPAGAGVQDDSAKAGPRPVEGGDGRKAAVPVAAGARGDGVTISGLDAPSRPTELQYTAPSVDGDERVTSLARPGRAEPADDGRTFPGTARNVPCPCGSGEKYKRCHGKNEDA